MGALELLTVLLGGSGIGTAIGLLVNRKKVEAEANEANSEVDVNRASAAKTLVDSAMLLLAQTNLELEEVRNELRDLKAKYETVELRVNALETENAILKKQLGLE